MKNSIKSVLLSTLLFANGCSDNTNKTIDFFKSYVNKLIFTKETNNNVVDISILNNKLDTIIIEKMRNNGNLRNNYSRFKIIDTKNGKKELIGSMISLEKGAKAEYLTRNNNPEYFIPRINFDKIKTDYPSTTLIAALSFITSKNGGWKTLNIEGATIDDGKVINGDTNSKFQGVVTFNKGKINIYNKNTQFHNGVSSVMKYALNSGIDLAEQFLVIDGGNITNNIPSYTGKALFRFLTQKKDKTILVVDFRKKMKIGDALVALKNIGNIDKAITMDAGGVSESALFDINNNKFILGDHFVTKKNGYSNIVVFY